MGINVKQFIFRSQLSCYLRISCI